MPPCLTPEEQERPGDISTINAPVLLPRFKRQSCLTQAREAGLSFCVSRWFVSGKTSGANSGRSTTPTRSKGTGYNRTRQFVCGLPSLTFWGGSTDPPAPNHQIHVQTPVADTTNAELTAAAVMHADS